MNCIELMVEEHKNIKRMLAVIRKYCYKVLKDDDVDYQDFYKIIDFVRNYADKHHHGKEETLLFEMMMEELGTVAEKLVKFGMNIEHDMGRLHMQELEAAVQRVQNGDDESRLDIIANAISYTHLLHRHIDKEDNVAFVYAEKNLAPATLKRLDEECKKLEEEAENNQITQKYLALIDELEKKAGTTGS
ncbi:hemerythrin domain-containing protein [Dethiobacter alkaliphilus]|uniref:hemerythrin domain-containing protein n=1 Tax=Dethiobacter alkaliphilus TaxID=427926 RepID=UPI00222801DB|nr:hemerythrin domain-containing protein [Dethiobacter alkaliphilus]MCW3489280.1 hemerythrin domain-containing protein [Dethiobacter alkaliphilus]